MRVSLTVHVHHPSARLAASIISHSLRDCPSAATVFCFLVPAKVTSLAANENDAGRWAVVRVRDRGWGIPAAEEERIPDKLDNIGRLLMALLVAA